MDIRTIKTYTSHENRKVEDLHQTIKSDVKYSRLIVIGDVHGCVVELEELLLKCGYDSSKDLVVLVGDLVNKGPHSAKVVKLVRKYGFKSVIGNHDDYILLQKQLKRGLLRIFVMHQV